MTGDYKMEISVGRFPCENARECSTMVNKTLAYERPPQGSDSTWFGKGTTVVNEDNPYDQYYQPDSRLARGYWQSSGYTLCESLSDFAGHSSANVNAAAADGRAFITHRGQCVGTWWSPFNGVTPNTWNNGAKLPITVSGSCETMTLQPGMSMYGDQFVRAGTPGGLGGAVAYFGTTTAGSHISDRRSAVFRGFFISLYPEKELRLGPATIRGRARVDSLFPGQSQWYLEWTLFGDPELNVWTAPIRRIAVGFDSVIPMAPQTCQLVVTSAGDPVAGALVCLSMDSVVYTSGLTGYDGVARLPIDPSHIGMMDVTVTGRNLRPFEATCRVIVNNAPYLVESGTVLDDFIGNHDGIPNPGEQARYTVKLSNVGAYAANGVTAILRTSDPAVALLDSTSSYGNVMPESIAAGDPYELRARLDAGRQPGHPDVRGRDRRLGRRVDLPGHAARARGPAGPDPRDPARLDAGRQRQREAGPGRDRPHPARGRQSPAAARFTRSKPRCRPRTPTSSSPTRSHDTAPALRASTLFGTLGLVRRIGRAGPAQEPRGHLPRALPRLGHDLHLLRHVQHPVAGRTGCDQRADRAGCLRLLGATTTPTPPPAGRPLTQWSELAPPGPGTVIPVVSDSDAATRTLVLPFLFKYYGKTDNHDIDQLQRVPRHGRDHLRSGSNRPIPDTWGPPSLIAPFWDDLNPDENRSGYGTAYSYYDEANHRYLVEFKDFAHYNQQTIRETFMVSFCDPAYYPTPTGDGEIVYYYNRVSLNSGCTVGIEDATETRGIQYLYNNAYAAGAATVATSRAIKFTTNPPRGLFAPWLVLTGLRVSDTLYGNGNGRPEPDEVIEIVATVRNNGAANAVGAACVLRALDTEGSAVDSAASFGDIAVGAQADNSAHPFRFRVASEPHDSTADIGLMMTATDYATFIYSTVQLYLPTEIESGREQLPRRTALEMVRPNPLQGSGLGSASRSPAPARLTSACSTPRAAASPPSPRAGWTPATTQPACPPRSSAPASTSAASTPTPSASPASWSCKGSEREPINQQGRGHPRP